MIQNFTRRWQVYWLSQMVSTMTYKSCLLIENFHKMILHPTQITAMIGILLDQVSCGTNIIFLYFYFQKRVQTLFKRFQKKMRRLAMDIKQMLQNSTLLCRQPKLKHMIQHPASKNNHACP
uniref:Uncharacterized protein n=1 Tax=Zea mays TaxID=4577 RepID=C4J4P2_MAIZE|nr:unknown [Zea mays]